MAKRKPTIFGSLARPLRAAKSLTMADQAKEFGCTAAYVSQIETGERSVPEDWPKRFADWLCLSEQVERDLEWAASCSRKTVRLRPKDQKRASLAMAFARELNKLPDDKLGHIQKILDRKQHSGSEIKQAAAFVRELCGTQDILRNVEKLLIQLGGHVEIIPPELNMGPVRGYSDTTNPNDAHVGYTQDIYLGAGAHRSDARKTILEEFAHFLLHRGKLAIDGGRHKCSDWAMEAEVDLFLQHFFMPPEIAPKFESPEQASRLLRVPVCFARDWLENYGLWPKTVSQHQRRAA